MVELSRPPWYRRFGVVVMAATLVVAAVLVAVVVALWPPAPQRPGDPATTAGVAPQADQVGAHASDPGRMLPSSTTAGLEPDVLWQRRGSDAEVGELFAAPGRWRISWSFDCRSFAEHGGGNFKLFGGGDFNAVGVQRFGVRGSGKLLVVGGGRGRLIIESVCERWLVRAVAT